MSVESDPGFWKWVAGGVISAAGGAWGFLKWHHSEMQQKADKRAVEQGFARVEGELGTQRGHIGRIFEQIRESDQASESRHRELLMHLVNKKGE